MASDGQQVAAIGRELRALAAGATRDIARGVMDAAIEGTRVDTGLTAANWLASRRAPRTEPVGNRSASGVAAAQAAQEASRGELDAFTLADGKLYISNAEGNAERLNDRTDPGFVQRAIGRGVAAGSAAATIRAALASRRR